MKKVIWEIDVDADTAEEAARKALDIQRNPESIATIFTVIDEDCVEKIVDTSKDEEEDVNSILIDNSNRKLTKEEVDAYLKDEQAHCPFSNCKSIQIEGGSVDFEGDVSYQSWCCHNCYGTWESVYKLARIAQ